MTHPNGCTQHCIVNSRVLSRTCTRARLEQKCKTTQYCIASYKLEGRGAGEILLSPPSGCTILYNFNSLVPVVCFSLCKVPPLRCRSLSSGRRRGERWGELLERDSFLSLRGERDRLHEDLWSLSLSLSLHDPECLRGSNHAINQCYVP